MPSGHEVDIPYPVQLFGPVSCSSTLVLRIDFKTLLVASQRGGGDM